MLYFLQHRFKNLICFSACDKKVPFSGLLRTWTTQIALWNFWTAIRRRGELILNVVQSSFKNRDRSKFQSLVGYYNLKSSFWIFTIFHILYDINQLIKKKSKFIHKIVWNYSIRQFAQKFDTEVMSCIISTEIFRLKCKK